MPSNPTASPRELVIVTKATANVTVKDKTVTSHPDFDVTSINELLKSDELQLRPLFGLSDERLALQAKAGITPANLTRYKRLYGPDHLLGQLAAQMSAEETVEAAFIKPGVTPAIWLTADMEPNLTASVVPTPNFTNRQGYLDTAANGGIDAHFAWNQAGGRGTGVSIIDIEGAWCFEHDDLKTNQGGLVAGKAKPEDRWRNHGTAVLGIISADDNNRGITGICPEANVRGVSVFELQSVKGWGTAAAITHAALKLNAGDILLLELQRPGPAVNFEELESQVGCIPVEWWPDDLQAIKFATEKRGVIVVTAGGNGRQDLNSPIYDKRPDQPDLKFPVDWVNPFRRATNDSGSIIVGAGGPPTSASNLQRLEFSNFHTGNNQESIFDAQGWGEDVTTTGFGNLDDGSGPDENFWYTGKFSGTSSAAPMIAGALACLQGIQRDRGRPLLTPSDARRILRATGRPQLPQPPVERIGSRPDLRELFESLP
ncbi:MAG TPA: S8 family serine peptidase [Pyrinomonadaceae bacterium]|nr:S8 family serine peptidase [Pyrinomonadaceae bacterium]